MTSGFLLFLAKLAINVAFWPALLFLLLIGLVWPWWKSFWGINIVSLELAIVLALLSSIIEVDFHYSVEQNVLMGWVSVAALFLVGGIIIWRGFLVISAQLRGTYGSEYKSVVKKLWCRRAAKSNEASVPPAHDPEKQNCPRELTARWENAA